MLELYYIEKPYVEDFWGCRPENVWKDFKVTSTEKSSIVYQTSSKYFKDPQSIYTFSGSSMSQNILRIGPSRTGDVVLKSKVLSGGSERRDENVNH